MRQPPVSGVLFVFGTSDFASPGHVVAGPAGEARSREGLGKLPRATRLLPRRFPSSGEGLDWRDAVLMRHTRDFPALGGCPQDADAGPYGVSWLVGAGMWVKGGGWDQALFVHLNVSWGDAGQVPRLSAA
jgi:hypothetical protein